MKKQVALFGMTVALALAIGVPAAFAFSQTTAPGSIDLKTGNRIADPEDLMNDMAGQSSSGTYRSSLGNGTLQFGTPANPDRGVESRFAPNPSTVIVPSRH